MKKYKSHIKIKLNVEGVIIPSPAMFTMISLFEIMRDLFVPNFLFLMVLEKSDIATRDPTYMNHIYRQPSSNITITNDWV